ncbi:nitric oxide synthase oxygenase [Chungangia koreensis]|uniref:Nitric oxide synthase oxygenase n=1 Tax=Chungangia koreensis TaxID=752657 RepID=A0ABV8X753_9LACT
MQYSYDKLIKNHQNEAQREVTGNWTWLIPPMAPATTLISHKPYPNKKLKPCFSHQSEP